MKSEWRVTSNPINGTTMYVVYRLTDVNAVDHSGNREFKGEYTAYRETAQGLANLLNKQGADGHESYMYLLRMALVYID